MNQFQKLFICSFLIVPISIAFNPLALTETSVNPIEALFGSGYVCLHVSDPEFATSPSFQALAQALSRKFNKTPIVHTVGSNETTPAPHIASPYTIHIDVTTTTTTTTKRPGISNQIKKHLKLACLRAGYFSNPNNCSKFYRCIEPVVKGKQYSIVEFDCGEGTIFDERIAACNHPESVDPKPACWKVDEFRRGVRGQRTTTTTTPTPEAPPTFAGAPDSDEQIVEGQQPDTTDLPPVPPEEPEGGIEIVPHVPEDVCTVPGPSPHPENCSLYYHCLNEGGQLKPKLRQCPKGKIFVPDAQECVLAKDVNPKPPCHKGRWRWVNKVNVTELIEQFDQTTTPLPEEPEISGEDIDEIETMGRTQAIHIPPGHDEIERVTVNKTVIDTPGYDKSSQGIRGKKKSVTIKKPEGPRPQSHAVCEEEGKYPHPLECNKYYHCLRKGNGPLKGYRYSCPPETVFDKLTQECKEPKDIRPRPPPCALWDDEHRDIYQKILSEEVDEDQPTDGHPYEQVFEDDGKGGVSKSWKRVVTTVEPKEPGVIDAEAKPIPDYEEPTTTTTITPMPELPPVEITPPNTAEPQMTCDDDREIIARLTREKTDCLSTVSDLEKQKAKLESQAKKMQKELASLKKEKVNLQKYIENLDKTVNSYKEEVTWYIQHCPQAQDILGDEEGQAHHSHHVGAPSRRRRSTDDAIFSKPRLTLKVNEESTSSEMLDGSVAVGDSRFPHYDTSKHGNVDVQPQPNRPNYNHPGGSLNSERHGHSHWTRDDGNRFFAEIPLLIFIMLLLVFLTILILGCVLVRRLGRMSRYNLPPFDPNDFVHQSYTGQESFKNNYHHP